MPLGRELLVDVPGPLISSVLQKEDCLSNDVGDLPLASCPKLEKRSSTAARPVKGKASTHILIEAKVSARTPMQQKKKISQKKVLSHMGFGVGFSQGDMLPEYLIVTILTSITRQLTS